LLLLKENIQYGGSILSLSTFNKFGFQWKYVAIQTILFLYVSGHITGIVLDIVDGPSYE